MSHFWGNVMKSDLYFENSNQNFGLIQTQIRFAQQPLTHNTKFNWTLSNNPADKTDRAQSYFHFRHWIKEHIKKQMCHDLTNLLALESKLTEGPVPFVSFLWGMCMW